MGLKMLLSSTSRDRCLHLRHDASVCVYVGVICTIFYAIRDAMRSIVRGQRLDASIGILRQCLNIADDLRPLVLTILPRC